MRINVVSSTLLLAAARLQCVIGQSDAPSDVPSDMPSLVPAVTAPSAVPTFVTAPTAPTAPKTCAFSYNTGRCSTLMSGSTRPTEKCDCYTFCGNSFVGCKDFEDSNAPSIPGDCSSFNEVTGGCTKDSARGNASTSGAASSHRVVMAAAAAVGGLLV